MIIRIIKVVTNMILTNIKLLIIKAFNFKRFNYLPLNYISYKTTISLLKSGTISISEKVKINPYTTIAALNGGILKIGTGAFINNNCQVIAHKKIVIGDNVMIGPNVVIVDHDHQFSKNEISKTNFNKKEIIIGNNVWIGANCVILKGTVIGDNCIIGAGSVIKGEYNSNSIIIQKRITDVKKIDI